MAARTSSARSRLSGVIPLLIVAMVLTAILAVQAVIARQRHRDAAQRVVRDYAAILAEEYLRRLSFDLEMGSFTPLRLAIADYLRVHHTLPSREWLRANGSSQAQHASGIIDELFMVNFENGRIVGEVSDPLRQWILTEMKPAIVRNHEKRQTQIVRARLAGRERVIVYGARLQAGMSFGFTVGEQQLTALARSGLERFRHPGLLHTRLQRKDVFLRVRLGEQELVRSGSAFNPEYGLQFEAGAMSGGVLEGAMVQSSISSSAAPSLVAGGVPRSRLLELLLVLALTSSILIAATIVLGRERQLDLLRADFVAGVSHELRTPLTQIRMFSETLLLNRVRSEEERQRSVRIINQEATRLAYLVENLLFFSRSERSFLSINRKVHDVSELIEETVAAFAPLAQSRGVRIRIGTDAPALARVDADALRQAAINLLDNALKYGPRGQTVTVSATVAAGVLRIVVDDEGPGIPETDRERIWERFHRLSRDRGDHEGGSGIGLAVVRDIVARHGGRCWVENREQQGARFVIELPAGSVEDSDSVRTGDPGGGEADSDHRRQSGARIRPAEQSRDRGLWRIGSR
jgi:signal transduction histidine kinase